MTVHELKCWPAFFDAVRDGRKTFEVRKNDRGYQTGDILVLHKWDPAPREPLIPAKMQLEGWKRVPQPIGYLDEDALRAEVTYVLSGMGVEQGYVVMGIKLIPWEEPSDDES